MQGEHFWATDAGMAFCAVNYLQTRADVCPDILGCTGHSGGGTTACSFLTALDPRITVGCCFRLLPVLTMLHFGMRHCECNYVPGLLTLGDIGGSRAWLRRAHFAWSTVPMTRFSRTWCCRAVPNR